MSHSIPKTQTYVVLVTTYLLSVCLKHAADNMCFSMHKVPLLSWFYKFSPILEAQQRHFFSSAFRLTAILFEILFS